MIPESGQRFPDKIMRKQKCHDPGKWSALSVRNPGGRTESDRGADSIGENPDPGVEDHAERIPEMRSSFVLILGALLLAAGNAQAISRYPLSGLTCEAARALVQQEGAVIFRFPSPRNR